MTATMRSLDDVSLQTVQRAISGDRTAIEEIVRALEKPFFNLALRMMLNPADAEDATQECLIRVVTRLVQFRGDSKFSTWAWRIAVTRILDYRDQSVRRPMLFFEGFAADLADGLETTAVERAEDAVLLEEVKIGCGRALLQCLDGAHRLAYILGEIMGLDGAEAAEILAVSPTVYRKRLSRARERIRGALSAQCGIVNPQAACQCHRRLTRAIELGRVAPDKAAGGVDLVRLRSRIRQLDAIERAASYYRADPESKPRQDLVRSVLAAFSASEFT
jgi:RNA polymerase sigma factor (sigma-70 family)